MFSSSLKKFYAALAAIPTDALAWAVFSSFALITAAAFILNFKKPLARASSKRPYLHLVNAYTGLTLAVFLTDNGVGESVLCAALFWCAGYILYGALCFFSRPQNTRKTAISQAAVSSAPVREQLKTVQRESVPAVRNNVRLEHAVSVTEKLLQKNLSKSDRQELEKLKNTLAVLRIKGTLSSAEAEILNENFNTLLKLMAKYNV